MNICLKIMIGLGVVFGLTQSKADFREEIIKRFPSAAEAKIEKAFPGFYSIVKGSEVIFISQNFEILINGDVIDLKEKMSITNKLRTENKPRADITLLNKSDAIAIGSGKRTIYVFSDPDCPYCRQLENELAGLSDVKIYVFLFPIETLHPNAKAIATSIWCSPDKGAAWRNYMLRSVKPVPGNCESPVAKNLILGNKLQVNGTPTMIFEDGSVLSGAVSSSVIEYHLGKVKEQSKKKEGAE